MRSTCPTHAHMRIYSDTAHKRAKINGHDTSFAIDDINRMAAIYETVLAEGNNYKLELVNNLI